jgi:hypothetical protein
MVDNAAVATNTEIEVIDSSSLIAITTMSK